MSGRMEGRGLFYGATGNSFAHRKIFSSNGQVRGTDSWDGACKQAKAWGLQWLHPKVADGGNWWYSLTDLHMMMTVAHSYGLKLAPYHYCYGNKYGYLLGEADIAATIANICDGCCPDIEVEWNGQAQWAMDFGKEVRAKSPHGLFVPTLYADPYTVWGSQLTNATPYAQLSSWMDAWMPMAYFSEWYESGHQFTAQNAIDFLQPQWRDLSAHIEHSGFLPKAVLPLIELGSSLPPQEVFNWLHLMGHYGYCGFWYDGQMSSAYDAAIQHAPIPAFPTPTPPTPTPKPQDTPYSPPPLKGPGLTDTPGDPQMNQNLTSSQLAVMWHMGGQTDPTNVMDLNHPIPLTWATLMQKHPDFAASYLGGAIGKKGTAQMAGVSYEYIDFTGGARIVYFPTDHTVAVSASPVTGGRGLTLAAGGEAAAQAALLGTNTTLFSDQPTRLDIPVPAGGSGAPTTAAAAALTEAMSTV